MEAVVGVFVHRLQDNGFEVGRNVGLDLRRGQGLFLNLLHGDAYGIGAVEGKLARGGFIEHAAERVHVRGAGELFALGLLRRNVVCCAKHAARLRFHGVFRARDAEVHDFHVAVGLDHDVLRLHVAVDDVLVMRDGKRLAYLAADLGDLALIDGAALQNGALQIGAAHVFHDNEVRAVIVAPVVHVHDVGALQVGRRCGFLLEARREFGVGCVLRQHHLHSDNAAERLVLGLVDLGHAANADALGDAVSAVEYSAYHVSLLTFRRRGWTYG